MLKVRYTLAAAALALVGLVAQSAWAGGDCGCCSECGCDCGVRKVCRLKQDKRKIEKIVYGCKCEDICVPGKSCRGCKNCEEVCGKEDCDCCSQGPYACLKWFDWSPNCACVKTVKKLQKYSVTKEVCGWKWEVVEVCGNCCPDDCCVPAKDGTPVEKAPVEAKSADELPVPPVPVSPAAYQQILGKN